MVIIININRIRFGETPLVCQTLLVCQTPLVGPWRYNISMVCQTPLYETSLENVSESLRNLFLTETLNIIPVTLTSQQRSQTPSRKNYITVSSWCRLPVMEHINPSNPCSQINLVRVIIVTVKKM